MSEEINASNLSNLSVGDSIYDIAHLLPTTLKLVTSSRPGGINIRVVFSNHCYTESFKPDEHAEELCIMDGSAKRAFSAERHDLSFSLPDMIKLLPEAKVYLTPEANFFQLHAITDDQRGEYRMFFRLKRSHLKGIDLLMFVESAYRPVNRAGFAGGHFH